MKKYLYILSVLISLNNVSGQVTIKGLITDANDSTAVQGAHIVITGTNTGTTSDASGRFTINCDSLPCLLTISHIRYKTLDYAIQSSESKTLVNLQMIREIKEILPFTVFDKPVICLHPQDKYFISDYSILNNQILAVAYKNRKYGQQYLVMFDAEGSKAQELPISGFKGLVQDPENNCYVKMYNKGWQVYCDTAGLFFSEPFEERYIDSIEKHLAAIKQDTFLIREYFLKNQGIAYYYWNSQMTHAQEFKTYINKEAIQMLYWGSFFDGNEFDRRFSEQIFFKPVKSPVFIDKNQEIIVFNLIEHKIEKFDCLNCEGKETIEIDFSENRNWTGEILHDHIRNRYYTVFLRQGISRLSEIDINTGNVVEKIQLKGYAHIEKIRVCDGKLYFLYKDIHRDDYKRLYMSYLY